MKRSAYFPVAALLGLALANPLWASGDHGDHSEAENHGVHVKRLLMPLMSSCCGMTLFAGKDCVDCLAANGIGGHVSSSLDAHERDAFMNPFDVAAKMWAIASYMIAAQEEALGEQILFSTSIRFSSRSLIAIHLTTTFRS